MHEEVSVVIPGAKNSEQVIKNTLSSSLPNINDLMEKIEGIYNSYLKNNIHSRW